MSINFENLPRFINAYDVSSDVIAYAEVLGAGTGAAIAYVRATTETLGQ